MPGLIAQESGKRKPESAATPTGLFEPGEDALANVGEPDRIRERPALGVGQEKHVTGPAVFGGDDGVRDVHVAFGQRGEDVGEQSDSVVGLNEQRRVRVRALQVEDHRGRMRRRRDAARYRRRDGGGAGSPQPVRQPPGHFVQPAFIRDVALRRRADVEHVEDDVVHAGVDVGADDVQSGAGERAGNGGEQAESVPRAEFDGRQAAFRMMLPADNRRGAVGARRAQAGEERMDEFEVPGDGRFIESAPVPRRHVGEMHVKFLEAEPVAQRFDETGIKMVAVALGGPHHHSAPVASPQARAARPAWRGASAGIVGFDVRRFHARSPEQPVCATGCGHTFTSIFAAFARPGDLQDCATGCGVLRTLARTTAGSGATRSLSASPMGDRLARMNCAVLLPDFDVANLDRLAQPVAVGCGWLPMDAAARLRRGWGFLGRDLTEDAARTLVDGLTAHGVRAVAMAETDLRQPQKPLVIVGFAAEPAVFVPRLQAPDAAPAAVRWEDLVVVAVAGFPEEVIRGATGAGGQTGPSMLGLGVFLATGIPVGIFHGRKPKETKPVKTTRLAQVGQIITRTGQSFLFSPDRFDFAGLGAQKQLNAGLNLRALISALAARSGARLNLGARYLRENKSLTLAGYHGVQDFETELLWMLNTPPVTPV